jgi:hypothetical protein
MNLLTLQRTMARAVMQPLTRSENMSSVAPNGERMKEYAARFIKPNDRLTSFERLEIYNRQYWWRVLESLAADFPGLQAILGNRRFEDLSRAYLIEHPSHSFTMRNLGSDLKSWLEKNPKWAGSRQNMALDMIRLEWADIEAFDGAQEEPLKLEDAARSEGANLRLRLQPYVRLLDLRYPVDKLLLKVKDLNEDSEVSSNTFRERRKHKQVLAVAKLKPARIFLAVHRVDNSVYFRRLDANEYALLLAIQNGKTLGQAVTHALGKKAGVSELDLAQQVSGWFQNWMSFGWFCAGARKGRAH